MHSGFEVISKIIKPGGTIIIFDFFRKDGVPGRSPMGGGHSLSSFYKTVAEFGLTIEEDIDVTVDAPEDPPDFIDVGLESDKEEPKDPKETEKEEFGIEGANVTGRNAAFETFKQIENQIASRDEILSWIASGRIRDAKTLVGLYAFLYSPFLNT